MILELNKNEFSNILPLTKEIEYNIPLVFSVIEKKQNGRIFVDCRENPSVALIYHEMGKLNLIGNDTNEEFNNELKKLIFEDIDHKKHYFSLCIHSQGFGEKIERLLNKAGEKKQRTCLSLSNLDSYLPQNREIPKEFKLKHIDNKLMSRVDNEMNFCKGYWNSTEELVEYGLGYALLQDEKLASVCYSCTVGNGEMEIDLETLKEFEGKGLATAVTSVFIDNCIKKGMTPVWVCNKDNIASYNLAKKFGFNEKGCYSQYWWLLNKGKC